MQSSRPSSPSSQTQMLIQVLQLISPLALFPLSVAARLLLRCGGVGGGGGS